MKIILFTLIASAIFCFAYPQSVRPVRDSVGFCWNAVEMDSLIAYLSRDAGVVPSNANRPGTMIGGISVHDDYLYAGRVYYPLYSKLRTKEVVIFGVTHGDVRKAMNDPKNILLLDEFDTWQGPYGMVAISPLRELIKEKLPKEDFSVSNKAQSLEHSIEALVPFLQYYNRDVKITPIMITQMSYERMSDVSKKLSKIILEYVTANHLTPGRDIFFLISNDADHYGEDFNNTPFGMNKDAHERATNNDKRIIAEDLTGEISAVKIKNFTAEVWPDSANKNPVPLWCGRYPIVFGLMTITDVMNTYNGAPLKGELLKYSDSFTEKVLPVNSTGMGVTAVFSLRHWCGFFTLGIYADH